MPEKGLPPEHGPWMNNKLVTMCSILVTGERLLRQNPLENASVLSPRSYLELQLWNDK